MLEVVLARHGESETSARGLVGGDAPLTEAGRAQAAALGRALEGAELDVCLTSTARRAAETAALVLEGRDVPIERVPALGDIAFGEFEGRPLEDYRAWIATRSPVEAPPGGESRVATLLRFTRAFRDVLARPERRLLVVAHGLTLRALLDERPRPAVAGAPYGAAVTLTRRELEHAVERLERWCESPAW